MKNIGALLSGLLVGFGLTLSQMTDRERVLGFLDVAGAWDPTLIFVLGGAVGVTLLAFRFVLRMPQPLLSNDWHLPTRQDIDRPLILGSAIFGIGWGIAGYCPGPAITALTLGAWSPVLFLVSMAVGSLAYRQISLRAVAGQSNQTGRNSQDASSTAGA